MYAYISDYLSMIGNFNSFLISKVALTWKFIEKKEKEIENEKKNCFLEKNHIILTISRRSLNYESIG